VTNQVLEIAKTSRSVEEES